MLKVCCYSSKYCFTFFCSFTWRLTESVCSTNALPIAMHCHARTLFLFTYAKIAYISVHTYPSKIQYIRYVSSSLYGSPPLADVPRRGPVPKLLWADLFYIVVVLMIGTMLLLLLLVQLRLSYPERGKSDS